MRTLMLGIALNLLVLSNAYSDVVGGFTGRIIASNGQPVVGATVAMPDYQPDRLIVECISDDKGEFTLSIVERKDRTLDRHAPGLYIEANGYVATYVDARHLTFFPGNKKHLGDIVMDKGRSYTGRVLDHAGKSIAGAKVKCGAHRHVFGHTVNKIGKEMLVVTDSDGKFQTPALPLGSPYVYVSADGFLLGFYRQKQFDEAGAEGRLPELRLKHDSPIHGVVNNEAGEPISHAKISANGRITTTDSDGRFAIGGYDENAKFQLQISVDGYAFINWSVTRNPNGFECFDVRKSTELDKSHSEAYKKAMRDITFFIPKLEITMMRAAEILGSVVDSETNMPVAISRIVLCTFSRKPDGEVVLNGCFASQFNQPQKGIFSIGYTDPTEYHLTVSAEGYEDGEAFTPPLKFLKRVDGIVVKMKRKAAPSDPSSISKQRISGTVVDSPIPLENGRVALWSKPKPRNASDVRLIRGRTTVGDGFVAATTMIENGTFELDVPYQSDDWHLLIETPARIALVHGPISITKGERKTVALETEQSGGLSGVVQNFSKVDSPLFSVLFSELGVQYECRVRSNGTFEFQDVLPGKYGLKVGCDSLIDSEIPKIDANASMDERLEISRRPSEPWRRAQIVVIESGQVLSGIEIAFEQ